MQAPVSGTVYNLYIKKPAGHVDIKKITVSTAFVTSFARCKGWLYNLGSGRANEKISLYGKVFADLFFAVIAFKGLQEWPHNFSLRLQSRSQNTDGRFYYTIEYVIPTEEEIKKRDWWKR